MNEQNIYDFANTIVQANTPEHFEINGQNFDIMKGIESLGVRSSQLCWICKLALKVLRVQAKSEIS